MKIHVIETGNFKLDGGAMFGVVPKTLWSRSKAADADNMCSWAMRCLLLEYADRLLLIDTGIGTKQSEKFFSHYHLFGTATLKESIRKAGFSPSDITDVFLTHLHFDHCGGAVERVGDELRPTFPVARYWSNEAHWKWATQPNAREKASFLPENILPLQEHGVLHFVTRDGRWSKGPLFEGFNVFFADGHTESQMIPYIDCGGKVLVYCADLLPSADHIPLPYVMGYDVRPLETLVEKELFLEAAAQDGHVLFLEHDLERECVTVHKTEKGVRLHSSEKLASLLP